jgi:hypothetical protein
MEVGRAGACFTGPQENHGHYFWSETKPESMMGGGCVAGVWTDRQEHGIMGQWRNWLEESVYFTSPENQEHLSTFKYVFPVEWLSSTWRLANEAFGIRLL